MLEEAGVNLPETMKEEGLYTTKRIMSSPTKKRPRKTFVTAESLELPTPKELDITTDE